MKNKKIAQSSMPVSVSDFIGVDHSTFWETGAFDAILNYDSLLFIDPHLLAGSTSPELRAAYDSVEKRFSDIMTVLRLVKKAADGDPFWREAERLFTFPELRGLCFGYSAKGTRGRGMGPQLRKRTLATAKQIVDAGITDPKVFEIMGMLEEGVGPDCISDMVARIAIHDIAKYSERVFATLNLPCDKKAYDGQQYGLPVNPFNGSPILLVPRDVLRDLPVALCWRDIDSVCRHNAELRDAVNEMIRGIWCQRGKKRKRLSKSEAKGFVLSHPNLLRDLLKRYSGKPAEHYDFDQDPKGEHLWLRVALEYGAKYPISLHLAATPSAEEVLEIVMTISNQFKDLVENNGLSRMLYCDGGKPRHEHMAQGLFFTIAHCYCEANNLDLSPESNSGRGPVDFKISGGYQSRVLAETKLSTNTRLIHGYETQLAEYQKAEKSAHSVYIVIDVGNSFRRIRALQNRIAEAERTGKCTPYVLFVDAKPKSSASRYKP